MLSMQDKPVPKESQLLQWQLPQILDIPPDKLRVRLDFYDSSVVMHICDQGVTTTLRVSARDVAAALLSEMPLVSGLLSPNTLWWSPNEVGLWELPQVWPVALVLEAFKQPRRFRLPMPGLIFICRPGQPPRVYAAKSRPRKMEEPIYHAPLFNVFHDGRTCQGTHKYPLKPEDIPKSFFSSWFTVDAHIKGRSVKYPDNLLGLWEALNGRKRYPNDDLVQCGTMEDILKGALPQPTEAEEAEPGPQGDDGEVDAEAEP